MSGEPRPGLMSRLVRHLIVSFYRARGWKAVGDPPADAKAVLIGVPHTSNWDFVFFLGVTADLGIQPNFMGKDSLFRWPMRRFMREMGGVAVNRRSSQNYVDAMAAEFAARDAMLLVIAPEGTRSGGGKWKSGFYHIAHKAGVPIYCGWVDYPARRGGLGMRLVPTGDYRADMARIAEFYRTHGRPRHPARGVTELDAMLGDTTDV